MQYFFVYLLIIIINIVAVLAVLRVRRNRQNDPNVITDVKDSDIVYESDSPQQEKRPGFSSRFSRNSNLSLGFNEIGDDDREVIYGGDLLELAVKKKVIKKNGNWYLYEDEKIAYGKDKAKFYLLENPVVAAEISNRVYGTIKVQNNEMSVEESSNELADQSNNMQNLQSVNLLSQEYEVELAEVYVKSNTLKKVIENTIGTEVLISIDISEKFNPVLNPPEVYAAEVIGLLNEIDYMIAAVENVSKNSKYLGIEVTEEMLREKLTLMTSNRFSIVFTKKPVERHRNIPRLIFDLPVKKNRRQREATVTSKSASSQNTNKKSLLPLGVGLLIVGFIILIYSVNQTFFSTSVIDDEQDLLENKFQVSELNLSEMRNQKIMTEQSLDNLEQTDEFQESIISIATKTLTNQAAKAEFLPDVVGRLTILSANINHYVVFGATNNKLEYGPGYILGTSLPGSGGNFAIAGHRTTYGAPFGNLDRVQVGETIIFQTNTNQYKYEVIEVKIVSPEDNYILENYGDDRITLTTCHPKFSAKQRLVVIGQLEKVEVFG